MKSRNRKRYNSKKSRKKSKASQKGWDTRVRKEGIKQLSKVLISQLSSKSIDKIRTSKDFVMSIIKIASPRTYRKNRYLKKLDKSI